MRCFSPTLFYLQWLSVTSFHALTYIIYKKYHFLPKFSPNGGHFGYLDFSKYVFTGMYVGMVFWEKTIYFMALIRKNDHFFLNFGLFWAIFGNFLPIPGIPNMRCFSPALFSIQWLSPTRFHALTYITCKNWHFLA